MEHVSLFCSGCSVGNFLTANKFQGLNGIDLGSLPLGDVSTAVLFHTRVWLLCLHTSKQTEREKWENAPLWQNISNCCVKAPQEEAAGVHTWNRSSQAASQGYDMICILNFQTVQNVELNTLLAILQVGASEYNLVNFTAAYSLPALQHRRDKNRNPPAGRNIPTRLFYSGCIAGASANGAVWPSETLSSFRWESTSFTECLMARRRADMRFVCLPCEIKFYACCDIQFLATILPSSSGSLLKRTQWIPFIFRARFQQDKMQPSQRFTAHHQWSATTSSDLIQRQSAGTSVELLRRVVKACRRRVRPEIIVCCCLNPAAGSAILQQDKVPQTREHFSVPASLLDPVPEGSVRFSAST